MPGKERRRRCEERPNKRKKVSTVHCCYWNTMTNSDFTSIILTFISSWSGMLDVWSSPGKHLVLYSENWFILAQDMRGRVGFRWMRHQVKFPDQMRIQDMKTNACKLDACDLCSLICHSDARVNWEDDNRQGRLELSLEVRCFHVWINQVQL